jgi:maleylpyruvate isomerase
MAQVPVLQIDDEANGVLLTQSLAIMEYLEEVRPSPPLLPSTPLARAKARELAEIVNSGIQPLQNLSLLQTLEQRHLADKGSWAKQVIETGLNALERNAKKSAGRFLVGDEVSIADVCLIPQLYNARRFGCSMNWPTLLHAEGNCERLQSFQAAHPAEQPDAPNQLEVA